MTKLKDILFPVQKVTMAEATAGILVGGTSETEYAIVGEIDGKSQLLNSCSSRYHLVSNKEIFAPIEKELKARGIDYDADYKNINNVKFYGKYTLNDDMFKVGSEGDVVKPMINVCHSYNGLLNYNINMGYYRLICANGLVVPVKGHEQHNFHVKGKHTPNLIKNVELFFEKLDFFLTQKELAKGGFDSLLNTKVKNLDSLLMDSMKAIGMNAEDKRSDNKKSANFLYAKDIAMKEAKKLDSDMNLWLVYNAVNNTIFNDNLNTKHDEFRTADDKVLMTSLLELV